MAERGQTFTDNIRPNKRARHEPNTDVMLTIEESVDKNRYGRVAAAMESVSGQWCVGEKSEINQTWLTKALNSKTPKQKKKQLRILLDEASVDAFENIFTEERNILKRVKESVASLGLAIALVEVYGRNSGPFFNAIMTAKKTPGWGNLLVPDGEYTYLTAVCANPNEPGAGSRLITKIIDDAKEKGHYAVVLRTASRNLVDFYKKDKFKFVGGNPKDNNTPLMVRWLADKPMVADLEALLGTTAFDHV